MNFSNIVLHIPMPSSEIWQLMQKRTYEVSRTSLGVHVSNTQNPWLSNSVGEFGHVQTGDVFAVFGFHHDKLFKTQRSARIYSPVSGKIIAWNTDTGVEKPFVSIQMQTTKDSLQNAPMYCEEVYPELFEMMQVIETEAHELGRSLQDETIGARLVYEEIVGDYNMAEVAQETLDVPKNLSTDEPIYFFR